MKNFEMFDDEYWEKFLKELMNKTKHDEEDYGDINDSKHKDTFINDKANFEYALVELDTTLEQIMQLVAKHYVKALQIGFTQSQAFEFAKIIFTFIIYK